MGPHNVSTLGLVLLLLAVGFDFGLGGRGGRALFAVSAERVLPRRRGAKRTGSKRRDDTRF